jgi:hypothetical protein
MFQDKFEPTKNDRPTIAKDAVLHAFHGIVEAGREFIAS